MTACSTEVEAQQPFYLKNKLVWSLFIPATGKQTSMNMLPLRDLNDKAPGVDQS